MTHCQKSAEAFVFFEVLLFLGRALNWYAGECVNIPAPIVSHLSHCLAAGNVIFEKL